MSGIVIVGQKDNGPSPVDSELKSSSHVPRILSTPDYSQVSIQSCTESVWTKPS